MAKYPVTRTTTPKERPDENNLGFGKKFTDHMFLMNYTEGQGWHDGRIVPYAPFELDPACMVFHYAQEIFEGMKAYRTADGTVQLFRPVENARRINASGERMCIPPIPEEDFVDAVKELVAVDEDWVPHAPGTSLYIRPFIIASDVALGVHASKTYIFCVICSPSGSYYAGGMSPVKIYVENDDVRAVRGGTGFTKCGGNYAGSIRAAEKAEKAGYSQVLWLDGVERKYIEEVGAMNVMFKIGGKVVTPALNGTVLPGITRKSCIELIRSWGIEVEERLLSAKELFDAAESGLLEEAWGTGTAAVVSPIGEMKWNDREVVVNGGQIGQITQKLYDELTGIQWGRVEDTRGWIVKV
ncbi:MAG: branched-chain amino acid aminotransferase [Oscillospiraceae bacterium]|nr:branched-chain amino acid aminotransferase [Oscillospiraceae bacterium]